MDISQQGINPIGESVSVISKTAGIRTKAVGEILENEAIIPGTKI